MPHDDISTRLVRLEERVDQLIHDMNREKTERHDTLRDLEQRMRHVEQTVWKGIGILSTVILVVNVAMKLFVK